MLEKHHKRFLAVVVSAVILSVLDFYSFKINPTIANYSHNILAIVLGLSVAIFCIMLLKRKKGIYSINLLCIVFAIAMIIIHIISLTHTVC